MHLLPSRPTPSPAVPAPAARADLRPAWTAIGVALAAGLVALAGLVLAGRLLDAPVAMLTRDAQDYAGVPWYTGSASTLTIAVWAAVAALSALVAWTQPEQRGRLGSFAGFVAVLMVDDAVLLHEAVGPENGVPQVLFVASYAVGAVVLLAAFVRSPQAGPALALTVGGALLAASVLVDQLVDGRPLLEDGFKLLGTVVWLAVPVLAVRRPDRLPG